jgi:hypothetical protein
VATTVRLPDPPEEYDRTYMERLVNHINLQFRALDPLGIQERLMLDSLTSEPPKIIDGLTVKADGTLWNPDGVNGEGPYMWWAGAWHFLGGGGGGGAGTVTSVGQTVPAFLSVAGSPIVNAGTLAITLSGLALPVTSGGTGDTTLTDHGVLIGQGTTAVAITSAGTSGYVLTSNGASADPTFEPPPGAGRHAIWITAGSMTPSAAAAAGCAALATIEAPTSGRPDIQTLNFDKDAVESAQFNIRMPKSWDEGTITFVPVFSYAGEDSNEYSVSWSLAAVSINDGEPLNIAFGTAVTSDKVVDQSNDQWHGPESAEMTVNYANVLVEGVVRFKVSRVATDATNDTLNVDARLHGLTIYITTDAVNDA